MKIRPPPTRRRSLRYPGDSTGVLAVVGAVTAARLPTGSRPRDLTVCQDPAMDAADLVTFRELEELKYRYTRALDHKDWELFASCFTEDATATYGTRLEFTGPDEIVAYMRENLGTNMITVHQVHHPEFAVDGDTATNSLFL